MIRNLLYSISLHLFLILVLYSNTVLYKPQKSLDLSTNNGYIKKIDEEKLAKIKKNLSGKSKLSGLTLKQKINLYENYDRIKSIKAVDYNRIKNDLKRNKVFRGTGSKGTSKTIVNEVATSKEISNINSASGDYNRVEKESYNLYVAESDLTNEQIEAIKKQNEIKKEIRKEIKTTGSNVSKKAEKADLNKMLNSLDKDLVVVNDTNNEKYEVVSEGEQSYMGELTDIMEIEDIDELMKLKDSISDEDVNNIFTKEDYSILSDKTVSIYELSFREKSNIQRQIRQCYRNAVLKTQVKNSLVMSAKISLSKNGQINMNDIVFKIVDEDNLDSIDNDAYISTVENIKLALVYCNPLRGLPSFKYNVWKNMSLTFDN